jgi:hypothetical protein
MKKLRDYRKTTIYTDISKTGLDMRIDHPDFSHFPLLQDAVIAFLEDLPKDELQKFLDKYQQPDLGWLHLSLITFKAWFDLAADIEKYINIQQF